MSSTASDRVTRCLSEIESGRAQAADELLPLVYEQLHEMARQRMAQERPGGTLQATALVHEAYLRLVKDPSAQWAGRTHFFWAAAEAMRRILIDHARRRQCVKRGGQCRQVPLSVLDLAAEPDSEKILALDEAISRLEKQAPDAAAVVRLRFYAGLSVEETAKSLGVSLRTIHRDWTFARAWLIRELGYSET